MTTYVIDIDGTICSLTDGNYKEATPFKKRIEVINELYEQGNTITLLTARGMGRCKNDAEAAERWFQGTTKAQLKEWGVKYHNLFFGKPSGDVYVDDKGVNDFDFFTD